MTTNQIKRLRRMSRPALEMEYSELFARLSAVEQLIDRPVAESGGYHFTVANMPAELVSEIRALLARA